MNFIKKCLSSKSNPEMVKFKKALKNEAELNILVLEYFQRITTGDR